MTKSRSQSSSQTRAGEFCDERTTRSNSLACISDGRPNLVRHMDCWIIQWNAKHQHTHTPTDIYVWYQSRAIVSWMERSRLLLRVRMSAETSETMQKHPGKALLLSHVRMTVGTGIAGMTAPLAKHPGSAVLHPRVRMMVRTVMDGANAPCAASVGYCAP
jgi:hypothetical protein